MKKNIVFILLISVSITAALIGYYWPEQKKQKTNQSNIFTTQNPEYRHLIQYVNASGNLKAKDQISVGSLVAGRVIEIKADDNDLVKKNDVLAVLDDGVGDAAVKLAQAKLDEAKSTLEYQKKFYARQTKLHQADQISHNQFEEFTQNYEVAQARVKQAEQELILREQTYNNLFIKTPDKGIVIAKKIDLGQMITSVLQATVLYEIAPDLKKMEAYVDIDEADIGMIKAGQEAVFTVDAFPRKIFKAKVDRVQFLAKIVEGVVTYATVLEVENPNLQLRPGMTTNVDVKVAEKSKALCIPNRAMRLSAFSLEEQAKNAGYTFERVNRKQKRNIKKGRGIVSKQRDTIWVLDGKKVKEIDITLGINDSRYSEIIKGVDSNTHIITEVVEVQKENKILKQIFKSPVGG